MKPGTMVYPLPAVMVSCGSNPDDFNIITIAWTGTICTDPPQCYVSIRPSRHSYDIIKKNGAFVINLTTTGLAKATDWCGVRSGRDYDKFQEMGLTAVMAEKVKAPIIAESPVNIECMVKEIKDVGVHHMFVAEVVNIQASEKYIDPKTGKFELATANPIVYINGSYYQTGKRLGKFGFSIQNK
jgi:flavin reductase (DIM6/NTAB) family NADH-FMN oxidoreductase RutF